ncbi:MAG: c-type cytochrome [Candidatus Thiodiazotropha endolucinida]
MKIIAGIVLILFLGVIGGVVIVTTGVFNVSAMYEDPAAIHWVIDNVRHYSIKRRAETVIVPDLDGREIIASGASAYSDMCAGCHGAPGKNPFVGAGDMNPPPPSLAELVTSREPGELFWAIKNGIRMTGMPAWGKTHSDEEIWQLVGFVEQLPSLSAAEYGMMLSEAAQDGHTHDHEGDETGHLTSEDDHHQHGGRNH